MKNTWDKQENETSKAFQKFCLYRDMGPNRSLRRLAEKLDLNPSATAELSKKFSWQSRVSDFDIFIDKVTQHNQIIQIKIMKRRQIALALNAQRTAGKYLKKLLREIDNDKSKIKLEGIAKLLDSGCRLERLNRDEPEQNIEMLSQQNFDRLTLEECEIYRRLQAKLENCE